MGAKAMSVTATNRVDELRSQLEQLPSERDWAVYRALRIEQWSAQAVASELGVSSARVGEMVQRTAAFIAQAVPILSKEDEPRQLAAGKQLAADRIEFLYGEAVSCFRASQGQAKSDCSTTRRNHGEVRYLHTAARLAILASTLPPPRPLCPTEPVQPPAASNHSKEACSAPLAEQPELTPPSAATSSATADAMVSCVEQSRGNRSAPGANARPVQNKGSSTLTPRQALRRESFFQTT
jgi:hypothetical protein